MHWSCFIRCSAHLDYEYDSLNQRFCLIRALRRIAAALSCCIKVRTFQWCASISYFVAYLSATMSLPDKCGCIWDICIYDLEGYIYCASRCGKNIPSDKLFGIELAKTIPNAHNICVSLSIHAIIHPFAQSCSPLSLFPFGRKEANELFDTKKQKAKFQRRLSGVFWPRKRKMIGLL